MSPNPVNFIGFGALDVTKPYEFIGFGPARFSWPKAWHVQVPPNVGRGLRARQSLEVARPSGGGGPAGAARPCAREPSPMDTPVLLLGT